MKQILLVSLIRVRIHLIKRFAMKSILKFLMDFFPTMLGVIFALLINDCYNNNQLQKQKKQAFYFLQEETSLNKEKLTTRQNYFRLLKDSLNQLLTHPDMIRKSQFRFFRGMGGARLKTSIYQSLITSNLLNQFDLSTVQKISDIYIAIDNYHRTSEVAVSMILNRDFLNKENLHITINYMIIALNDYDYAYDAVINAMDEFSKHNRDID